MPAGTAGHGGHGAAGRATAGTAGDGPVLAQPGGRTVDVVGKERGDEVAQPERIQPRAELLSIPCQHVPMESEHLQVWQPADRGEVGGDGLAVELVPAETWAGRREQCARAAPSRACAPPPQQQLRITAACGTHS